MRTRYPVSGAPHSPPNRGTSDLIEPAHPIVDQLDIKISLAADRTSRAVAAGVESNPEPLRQRKTGPHGGNLVLLDPRSFRRSAMIDVIRTTPSLSQMPPLAQPGQRGVRTQKLPQSDALSSANGQNAGLFTVQAVTRLTRILRPSGRRGTPSIPNDARKAGRSDPANAHQKRTRNPARYVTVRLASLAQHQGKRRGDFPGKSALRMPPGPVRRDRLGTAKGICL